jgi:glycosyltransferase involved in cell wall biosynthesis
MVDVCLIVEGAYPFITGGVSNWLHALISNLPQFTFAVVHLSDKPDPARKPKYTLPANVTDFREIFIHDVSARQPRHHTPLAPEMWQHFREFHQALHVDLPYQHPDFQAWLGSDQHQGMTNNDILYSQAGWELIAELNARFAPEKSFIDYFWTFRFTHLPLFALLEAEIPQARLYHAVSVGFGGYLGALAKLRTGRPLLLTEHGVYLREREIEIAQAEWIYSEKQHDFQLGRTLDFFQQWWLDMFRYMTKSAYEQADRIISITRFNTRYQLRYGADPDKLDVIPNGIDVAKLSRIQRDTTRQGQFNVGLVGRVVPIKDIKTFIRAIKVASISIPTIHGYIIGPTEEDPEYFAECQQIVDMLQVGEYITFTGQANVADYYTFLDVMVLTSLSEGQPLVILEGHCVGIPVVATDVGACRELLTGANAEDAAIGPSGLLTPADSPGETANALVRLWRNPQMRAQMGQAGRERTLRYYRQESLYAAYDALYRHYGRSR